MARKAKIDPKILAKLLQDKPLAKLKDLAMYFGCTPTAVKKAKDKLTEAVIKTASEIAATDVVKKKINITDEMQNNMAIVSGMIAGLEKEIKKFDEQEPVIDVGEKNIDGKRQPLIDENLQRKLILQGEIRKTIGVSTKLVGGMVAVTKELYNIENVKIFQETLIETLRETDNELCQKFLTNYRKKKQLNLNLGLSGK